MQGNIQLNSNTPRFAVCLAAYNGMQFIQQQVQSILAQTGVELVIFISVDHSSDSTQEFVESWVQTEPRLRVLPGGQRFGGAAPNFFRLLREINFDGFDYVSYADQDDIWDTDKLAHAHAVLSARGVDGYSANVTAFWEDGRTMLVRKDQAQRRWDHYFEAAGPGCTYVMTHRLAIALQARLRQVPKLLEAIHYHDWLTYAFARSNQFGWVIDSNSKMQYRQHAQNQIGVNAGWRSFWARARKISSGYGFAQARLIAAVTQVEQPYFVKQALFRGRCGLWWLALQARQCRRKPVEQLFFFFSCLLTSFSLVSSEVKVDLTLR